MNNDESCYEQETKPLRELGNLSPQVDTDMKSKRASSGDSGCESLPSDEKDLAKDQKENETSHRTQPKSDKTKSDSVVPDQDEIEAMECESVEDVAKSVSKEKMGDHKKLGNNSGEVDISQAKNKSPSSLTFDTADCIQSKSTPDEAEIQGENSSLKKVLPANSKPLNHNSDKVPIREIRLRMHRCDDPAVKKPVCTTPVVNKDPEIAPESLEFQVPEVNKEPEIAPEFSKSKVPELNKDPEITPESLEFNVPEVQKEPEIIPVASTSSAASSPNLPPPNKVRKGNDGQKAKVETSGRQTPELKRKVAVKQEPTTKLRVSRCKYCNQNNDGNLPMVTFPDGAKEELTAITDTSIEYKSENILDDRPTLLITDFSIYCKNNHLCPIDTGIIETDGILYACGYFKSADARGSGKEGGVPVKGVGPIGQWFIHGYDKEHEAEISVSSEFCMGLLDTPSDHYAPLMRSLERKMFLSIQMVLYILDHLNEDPPYEEMLEHLESVTPPEGMVHITEEELIHHAQFLFERVEGIIDNDEESTPMLETECVTHLQRLAGMLDESKTTKKQKPKADEKKRGKPKAKVLEKPQASKATVTPLVEQVFTKLFNEQMVQCNTESPTKNVNSKRCGLCEPCMTFECGKCEPCSTMLRFGGPGIVEVDCVARRCAIASPTKLGNIPSLVRRRQLSRSFKLCGQVLLQDQNTTYYTQCQMVEKSLDAWKTEKTSTFGPGDFVMLASKQGERDRKIARVQNLYHVEDQSFCHVQYFERATTTVLGLLADPHELVFVNTCDTVPVGDVRAVLDVKFALYSLKWSSLGGKKPVFPQCSTQKQFFFNKMYDKERCRFEDIPKNAVMDLRFAPLVCTICVEKVKQLQHDKLALSGVLGTKNKNHLYSRVSYQGMELTVGSCVYLEAASNNVKTKSSEEDTEEDYDPARYPEKCRKTNARAEKVTNEDPFCVARVMAIYTRRTTPRAAGDVMLQLARFYRPEDTCLKKTNHLDTYLLFWSEDYFEISLDEIQSKCWVRAATEVTPSPFEWCLQGPDRFYYEQAYSRETRKISKITDKQREESSSTPHRDKPEEYATLPRKLRTLDVFAGCGGLSLGLHQSGVAESRWAIEVDSAAAQAYQLNNPDCVMLQEDCNKLLELMLQGKTKTKDGLPLPQKHQVDLLCGGPPCQGFSGMNRFNTREYSSFKNSLIVTYLSYCDYLRPRYFLLENVRNLVAFKKNIVLKMILKALLTMGYQVTFGIMQAGGYGVPQTRRRAFILAAAPGEVLPLFPEPTHSFKVGASTLPVTIDGKTYNTNCKRSGEAPLRCVTVWDALSDLPEIESGAFKNMIKYGNQPISSFQKLMRLGCGPMLYDHICKSMSPLVNARMSLIPPKPNSDWRDLPNIRMKLSNGEYAEKLEYKYDSFEGKLANGNKRGVCPCTSKKGSKCNRQNDSVRQSNTLIPWCLPHTARNYNQWTGLYGRLNWEGIFATTVTNPEPMGKQGRVLHPEQHRVVSVRECARSQGFPDSFKFYGEVLNKHRQIGNAVPPPLACAIGREILKAVSAHSKH